MLIGFQNPILVHIQNASGVYNVQSVSQSFGLSWYFADTHQHQWAQPITARENSKKNSVESLRKTVQSLYWVTFIALTGTQINEWKTDQHKSISVQIQLITRTRGRRTDGLQQILRILSDARNQSVTLMLEHRGLCVQDYFFLWGLSHLYPKNILTAPEKTAMLLLTWSNSVLSTSWNCSHCRQWSLAYFARLWCSQPISIVVWRLQRLHRYTTFFSDWVSKVSLREALL